MLILNVKRLRFGSLYYNNAHRFWHIPDMTTEWGNGNRRLYGIMVTAKHEMHPGFFGYLSLTGLIRGSATRAHVVRLSYSPSNHGPRCMPMVGTEWRLRMHSFHLVCKNGTSTTDLAWHLTYLWKALLLAFAADLTKFRRKVASVILRAQFPPAKYNSKELAIAMLCSSVL